MHVVASRAADRPRKQRPGVCLTLFGEGDDLGGPSVEVVEVLVGVGGAGAGRDVVVGVGVGVVVAEEPAALLGPEERLEDDLLRQVVRDVRLVLEAELHEYLVLDRLEPDRVAVRAVLVRLVEAVRAG